jgi:Gram-negative bacterial TonB protein C-terminal
LKWKSKTEWWRKITMGGFEQIEVFKGDTRYILRNVSFEPEMVTQLVGLLSLSQNYDRYYAWNQKKRKLNGVEASCIQTKFRNGEGDGPEVCIDPGSHQIAMETEAGDPDEKTRREFTDYISFGSHQFPSNLKLRQGSSVVLSAHITSLKALEFDDALLTPPRGAIERRSCEGIKWPALIQQPSGSELALHGSGGVTTLWITVGTDGSVTDAHLIGRSTKEMDGAVLKSLHGWKYRPAMCGNEPVVADEMVKIGIQKY